MRSGEPEQKSFGLVKPALDGASVYLDMLRYDYPRLIELMRDKTTTPQSQWNSDFDNFMNSVPMYRCITL